MMFHVLRNGAPQGQFSEVEVKQKLQHLMLLPDDLYWTEGMAGWEPLKNRFGSALPMPPNLSQSQQPDELASPGSRLVARIIDGAITSVISVPVVACYFWFAASLERGEFSVISLVATFVAFFVTILPFAVYQLILLVKRGQTVGKRIMGIRIVCSKSNSLPSWVNSILIRVIANTMISNLTAGLYGLVDILMIFSQGNRCLHDRMASTQVRKGNPQVSKPYVVAGIALW
jgi:uncharacterized RDD family membrane protein YckC